MTFVQDSELTGHQRIHREKPYKCGIYVERPLVKMQDLWFIGEFILKRNPINRVNIAKALSAHSIFTDHQAVHIGEKPYKCNLWAKPSVTCLILQFTGEFM